MSEPGPPASPGAAGRARGFTLVEVLVAFAVLSFALAGIVALTIRSVRATAGAHHRIVATLLAAELAERMRVNLPGVATGAYRTAGAWDCEAPPVPVCAMTPDLDADRIGPCSGRQMAAWDLYEVSCVHGLGGAGRALPDGQLSVTCDGAMSACDGGSARRIRVGWRNHGETAGRYVEITVVPGKLRD